MPARTATTRPGNGERTTASFASLRLELLDLEPLVLHPQAAIAGADHALREGVLEARDLLVDGGDRRRGQESAIDELLFLRAIGFEAGDLAAQPALDRGRLRAGGAGLLLEPGQELAGRNQPGFDVRHREARDHRAGFDDVAGLDLHRLDRAAGEDLDLPHRLAAHHEAPPVDLHRHRKGHAPDDRREDDGADRRDRHPSHRRRDAHHHVELLGRRQLLDRGLAQQIFRALHRSLLAPVVSLLSAVANRAAAAAPRGRRPRPAGRAGVRRRSANGSGATGLRVRMPPGRVRPASAPAR